MREHRPDIISLLHIRIGNIWLSEGQQFYKTDKTWELWQETPLPRRITFWHDRSIVGEMPGDASAFLSRLPS